MCEPNGLCLGPEAIRLARRAGGHSGFGKLAVAPAPGSLTYFPRLRERFRQAAGSLSGGEQHMLAIGRALMSRPKPLMLDEPSLGLAPVIVQRIGELLHEIQSREQLSVILAGQNVNWGAQARVAQPHDRGRPVKLMGSAEELRNNEYVRKAYLGA